MTAGQIIRAGSPESPMGRVAVARANREAREARGTASKAGDRYVALLSAGMSQAEAVATIHREAVPQRLERAQEAVEIARGMLADAEAELIQAEAAVAALAQETPP